MIDITQIDENDPDVWEMISEGRVKGVFQIEGHLGKTWAKALQPRNMNELAALISIIRPGTLKAKVDGKSMTERFVDRKHGKEEIPSLHPSVDDLLEETFGVIVYQEQAMKIAERMAGFDLKEADNLRKAIGKKKADLMREIRGRFIEGCITNEIDESKAVEVFDMIEKSARYSFNKCVSGKETIKKSAKGRHPFNPTIEEMYKIRNDIGYAKATGHLSLYKKWKRLGNYGKGWSLCSDGRVRPNVIKDIIYQGKRETITIHLSGGQSITTTGNHKFPTLKGIMLAEEISVGDSLYVCGEYEVTDFKPLSKFSSVGVENRCHTDTYDGQGFPSGKNNPSYTNGGYTSFQAFKEQTGDVCRICQSVENVEVDHIDRDRTNNDWSNLQKLCSSCHKKKEYQNGRTRRGEKGYPSLTGEVVEITRNPAEDVYDVTMDAPNHNFAIDCGIITCNSHAVAYAKMGYWSAWLRCKYIEDFFKNWLDGADDKIKPDEEKKYLIMSAKAEGISVRSPTIKIMEPGFTLKGGMIYFGICNVKHVGQAHLTALKTKMAGRDIEDMTWAEFLFTVLIHINKRAVENLIKVHTFSFFGLSRTQMLHEFSCVSSLTKTEKGLISEWPIGTMDVRGVIQSVINRGTKKEGGIVSSSRRMPKLEEILTRLDNPGRTLSDNPVVYAKAEENLLGCSINDSELNACAEAAHADSTCKEVADGKFGTSTVACVIKKVREYVTKNGDTMAFVSAEDESGEMDNIVIFPDVYDLTKDIIYESAAVLITGELKDKKRNSFIINKAFLI